MDDTHDTPGSQVPPTGARVLLVADPGLPTARARAIEGQLQQLLDEAYSPPISLEVRSAMLRMRADETLDLSQAVELSESFGDPDVVLLLTEIPRVQDGHPLIAEIFPEQNIAVISCPTLGVVTTGRRIMDVMMSCTVRMKPLHDGHDTSRYERWWTRWREGDGGEAHPLLVGSRFLGGARTVTGMVVGNEPLRTAPRLSSALAAAAATGAFGIFYSSIWSMSMYLSTQRLVSVGVLAMLAITAWLIIGNKLWDAPKNQGLARVVLLYNLSTALTLLMIVGLLYVALVVLIFAGGLIVIAPEYLSEIIGRDAEVVRYLDIAWLSAAMGIVAGALGSSFDKETDLRSLTHGQRERQRMYTEEKETEEKETGEKG